MSALFHQGKVSDVTLTDKFKNVSNSITNHIRQYSGVPSVRQGIKGDVLMTETCVHIRWRWLAFPVALFLLTFIFFVWMVIGTTSRYSQVSGGHDFKSFALPLVFTGLDIHLLQQVQESRFGMDEIVHEARQIYVRLSKTEGSWKFVKDS